MLKRCLIVLTVVGFLFSVAPSAHAGSVNGTINFVGIASNGQAWLNITTTQGWVLNYMIPTGQTNTFMAVALSAISASKQATILSDGGDWSTLTGILMNSTSS